MEHKKARNDEMVRMRKNGASYTEIAERFGVSKNRVYQIVGERRGYNFRPMTPKRCVYPNLRKWMNDNEICAAELSRRCRGNASGTNMTELNAILKGKKGVAKHTIDKLIKVTGLTYEKLFYEGEET